MNNNLQIFENNLLDKQEQSKRRAAYHGEFFAMHSFDDGWRWNLYESVVNYVAKLHDKDVPISIFENITHAKWCIHIILTLPTLDDDLFQYVQEITTTLQRVYSMTPIEQNINYHDGKEEKRVTVLESPTQDHIWYDRFHIQSQLAQIFIVENDIERFRYLIESFHQNDDSSISQILWDLQNTYTQLVDKKNILLWDFQEALAQIYLKNATKSFGDWNVQTISASRADIIIDTQANTWWSETLHILDRIENLVHASQQQISQNKNDMNQFVSQISSIVEQSTGVNIQKSNYGVIGNPKVNDDHMIIGGINTTTWEEFHLINNTFQGISIPWVNDVSSIKLLEQENDIATLLYVTDGVWVSTIWSLRGLEYEKISIQWLPKDVDWLRVVQKDENGELLTWVYYNNNNCSIPFWKTDDWYKTISVDGNFDLREVEVDHSKQAIPLNGEYQLYGSSQKGVFYPSWLHQYTSLKIDWIASIVEGQAIEYNEQWIPISGSYRDPQTWVWKVFQKSQGVYKDIKIQWDFEDRSSIISNRDSDGVILSGMLQPDADHPFYRFSREIGIPFWLENEMYASLKIEWVDDFLYAKDINFSDDKISTPISGKYVMSDDKENVFYRSGDSYIPLSIKWVEAIKEVGQVIYDDNQMPIYGEYIDEDGSHLFFKNADRYVPFRLDGLVGGYNIALYKNTFSKYLCYWLFRGSQMESWVPFYLEWGSYKIFQIAGENPNKIYQVYDVVYDDNNIPISGSYKIVNKKRETYRWMQHIVYSFHREGDKYVKSDRGFIRKWLDKLS